MYLSYCKCFIMNERYTSHTPNMYLIVNILFTLSSTYASLYTYELKIYKSYFIYLYVIYIHEWVFSIYMHAIHVPILQNICKLPI